MKQPTLIIITGKVATGKTAFAKKLSDELNIPAFGMDEFKEQAFDFLGTKDRAWSVKLGEMSFSQLFLVTEKLLVSGQSLIIESTFDPEYVIRKVNEIQQKCEFRCLQIRLFANPDITFERFSNRALSGQRHPGHVDTTILEQTKDSIYKDAGKIKKIPLDCPFLDVDTTDFSKINYKEMLDFITKK